MLAKNKSGWILLESFVQTDEDEMSDIMLWDLKQDIGYVDECDLKIVEMVCAEEK